jgi:hypothetical protein
MSQSHRFARNGKPSTQHESDTTEYVKNEVDLKLDRLNELWMKLERKLLTQEPPRRICCLYYKSAEPDEHDPRDAIERRYLGIQRHAGKWRVCYANVWACIREDEFPWKPILECDAPTRAEAVRGIDDLKSEVRKTRSVFIPQLDKAISTLEDAIDDMDS